MADDAGVRITVNPAQFAAVLRQLKAFDPALATATRRTIRKAGTDTVAAIKTQLGQGKGSTRLKKGAAGSFRQGLAAGTKLAIVAGKTRQGVTITTSGARLAASQQGLRVAWNQGTFRHPVFGGPAFAQQPGRPYFGSVIRQHQQQFEDAVNEALSHAVEAMKR